MDAYTKGLMMKYLPTVIQDRLGTCLLGGGGLLEAQELRRATLRRRAERMEGRRVGVQRLQMCSMGGSRGWLQGLASKIGREGGGGA